MNRVLPSRKTPNGIIRNDNFKIQISHICKHLGMFDLILISLKGQSGVNLMKLFWCKFTHFILKVISFHETEK
jgi:hypothetical protein